MGGGTLKYASIKMHLWEWHTKEEVLDQISHPSIHTPLIPERTAATEKNLSQKIECGSDQRSQKGYARPGMMAMSEC